MSNMLIDTHAHLFWDSFEKQVAKVLENAEKAGVSKVIVPGVNLETSRLAINLANDYPGKIWAAVGIHPEEKADKKDIENLDQLIGANRDKIVAIGEVGTDCHELSLAENIAEQQKLLYEQVVLAKKWELPVILHSRNSFAETTAVLDKLRTEIRGVFHCFSYGLEEMQAVVERGMMIGIGGNVTWSKRIQRVASQVPASNYLVETDSPLMMPRDKQGKPISDNLRNEPANVRMLATLIAELRGEEMKMISKSTTDNAERLFGVKG